MKLVQVVKAVPIESLYTWAKQYEYNDQDDYKIILIACHDKFSTTHYIGAVWDNDNGETTIGTTLEI